MKKRRKSKYTFYALIDKELGENFENHLKETKQTKTNWLTEKIEHDIKK